MIAEATHYTSMYVSERSLVGLGSILFINVLIINRTKVAEWLALRCTYETGSSALE